jgi:hypothetical protein
MAGGSVTRIDALNELDGSARQGGQTSRSLKK